MSTEKTPVTDGASPPPANTPATTPAAVDLVKKGESDERVATVHAQEMHDLRTRQDLIEQGLESLGKTLAENQRRQTVAPERRSFWGMLCDEANELVSGGRNAS